MGLMTAPAPPVIGPMSSGDWDEFVLVAEHAFGETVGPAQSAFVRSVLPVERVLVARDRGRIVGQAASHALRMSVPGGALRTVAGVAWVAVLPTHRRRGILRALMRPLLEGMRERGEAVAALWASEPAIYGRFGFGLASRELCLRLPRGAALAHAPGRAHELRLATPADCLDLTEAIHAARVPERPGMIARERAWGGRPLDDPPEALEGHGPLRAVIAERDGRARGFARYAVRPAPTDGAGATVRVEALHACDPSAHADLWRYLLDLDLTDVVVAPGRPVDDPLLEMLADPRGARPAVADALYVRLVDAAAALAGRRYALPVDVVIDLRDEACPWNTGRLRLSGDATGAVCAPTRAPADIGLSAVELGAAHLGGTSLRALAGAGRVEELRPGAVAAASLAFAHDPAPWCAMHF